MIIEISSIIIEECYLTIYFKDGEVSTLDISNNKTKDKLIKKVLSGYGDEVVFKKLTIKNETINANLYLNKKVIIKQISFNELKVELNNIIKAAFKKLDKHNDNE